MSGKSSVSTAKLLVSLWVIISIVPMAIWRGYTLKVIWYWYLVRLGLPVINIPEAIGLSMAISYFTGVDSVSTAVHDLKVKKEGDEEVSDIISRNVVGWLAPGLTLFMGWILNHWM